MRRSFAGVSLENLVESACVAMSALGHSRRFAHVRAMSDAPLTADLLRTSQVDGCGPKLDIGAIQYIRRPFSDYRNQFSVAIGAFQVLQRLPNEPTRCHDMLRSPMTFNVALDLK